MVDLVASSSGPPFGARSQNHPTPDTSRVELLAVEGIDVFFIGPGDLSQNMGYPPAPPFGQPRPHAVIDKVGFTVDKIRAAGKIAGTLVTSDELPYWREKGVQFFYIHSDPFLRLGLNGIKKSLGR